MQTHTINDCGDFVNWRRSGRPNVRHTKMAASTTVKEHKFDSNEAIAGIIVKTAADGQPCSIQFLIEEI